MASAIYSSSFSKPTHLRGSWPKKTAPEGAVFGKSESGLFARLTTSKTQTDQTQRKHCQGSWLWNIRFAQGNVVEHDADIIATSVVENDVVCTVTHYGEGAGNGLPWCSRNKTE